MSFTFVRHGSGGHGQQEESSSSSVVNGDKTIDLTGDIIPEAPEVPVEEIAGPVGKILVE